MFSLANNVLNRIMFFDKYFPTGVILCLFSFIGL